MRTLLLFILVILLLGNITIASEQVTFTVSDVSWEFNDYNGDYYLYIETLDNQLYYIMIDDGGILGNYEDNIENLCEMYEVFSLNTTHTVLAEGHKILVQGNIIMTKTNLTIDPMKPTCPVCELKLVMNSTAGGITHTHGLYNIPLVCPVCDFELWIQAMPCGCTIEEQFADRLKGGDDND